MLLFARFLFRKPFERSCHISALYDLHKEIIKLPSLYTFRQWHQLWTVVISVVISYTFNKNNIQNFRKICEKSIENRFRRVKTFLTMMKKKYSNTKYQQLPLYSYKDVSHLTIHRNSVSKFSSSERYLGLNKQFHFTLSVCIFFVKAKLLTGFDGLFTLSFGSTVIISKSNQYWQYLFPLLLIHIQQNQLILHLFRFMNINMVQTCNFFPNDLNKKFRSFRRKLHSYLILGCSATINN